MVFSGFSDKSTGFTTDPAPVEAFIKSEVFCDRSLSSLEAVVVHLRDVRKLRISEIAKQLNRHAKTIWTTYHRSVFKRVDSKPKIKSVSNVFIPISVLNDRSLSILEVVVNYLVKNNSLTNHQIALLLNRSDKTIWTVKDRAKKKCKNSLKAN